MSDSDRALWKRHMITSALVGAVLFLVFLGITSEAGSGSFSRLPWKVEQAIVFVGLLLAPGLYLGAIASWIVGLLGSVFAHDWLPAILGVAFNAAIYSASWLVIRRGGPGVVLRRLAVLTLWVLYGWFAHMQATVEQS